MRDSEGAGMPLAVRRSIRLVRPLTANQLHAYVESVLGFVMPRRGRVAGHDSPFDYLVGAFMGQAQSRGAAEAQSIDCLVWSCRGGGKTQLGAIATLLDLVFKPGIQVRILGGSREQSEKMYEYLWRLLEGEVFGDLVAGKMTGKRVRLVNGSMAEVLSQSERSVRGQRVQVLRCDEVELFDPEVWSAGQLVTRSRRCGDIEVAGRVEGLSTMHRPFGLMQRLIEESAVQGRRVYRWSVVDILEQCPEERLCTKCSLEQDCGGLAKKGRGFVRIEDAIRQKSRVDKATWESEMLCLRAKRSDVVYGEFDPEVHVREASRGRSEGFFVGGVDFGYRAPTVVLWAEVNGEGDIQIVDELVMREMTTAEHLQRVKEKSAELGVKVAWFGADPAGHQMSEHTGSSTIAAWKKAGNPMKTRVMGIEPGIAAVRYRLRSADGQVRLFIDPKCKELIKALTMYHYPLDKPEEARPVKDGSDHAADALRYLVVNLDREEGGERGY